MEIVTIIAVFIVMGLLLLSIYLSHRVAHAPIKGLPWSVRSGLNQKAHETIAMIIKNLRGLPYEVEYIIDKDGNIIFEQTQYSPKNVEFTDEQIAYMKSHPGTISIHNHDTDTLPSMTDLSFSARTKQDRLIVVSPHYTYVVTPPASGWKSDDELNAVLEKYMHLFSIINYSEHFAGIAPDGVVLMATEIEYETTDEAMAAIVDELGYHYFREDA